MFQILFSSAPYAECKTIEEALSLALAVHQSSNLYHIVEVVTPDGEHIYPLQRK